MAKIIDFERVKLGYKLNEVVTKLKKVYKDVKFDLYFYGNWVEICCMKDKYIRRERIATDRLKESNLEELLKFILNNFVYEVYEKIEKDMGE